MKRIPLRHIPAALVTLASFAIPSGGYGTPVSATWNAASGATWNVAGNWTPNTAYPGAITDNGDTATINTSSNPFIVSDIYLDSIIFSGSTNSIITNNSGVQIIMQAASTSDANISTSSSSNTAVAPSLLLQANLNVTVSSSGNLTFQGGIKESLPGFGVSKLGAGTFILSGISNYSGNTNVSAGILQAGGANSLSPYSSVTVAGATTLNLAGNNNTIAGLTVQSTGTVTSSSAAILTISNGGSVSGPITGAGLGLNLTGGTLTISATGATYQGTTTISNALLYANATSALSSSSAMNIQSTGTLKLASSTTNSVSQLFGSGTVLLASSAQLSIASGGLFDGHIEDDSASTLGSIVVSSGTLELTNTNTYTGATTISSGATLKLSGAGQVSSSSSIGVTGTLDLSTVNTIANVVTVGSVGGGTIALGSKTLSLTNASSSYNGSITGTGGVTIAGGNWTLASGAASSYSGATNIQSGATLTAGASNVFAANSDFTVTGTLALGSNSATIKSLSGSGAVTTGTGTLTVTNGGTFTGSVGSSGGLTLNGGTLTIGNGGSLNALTISVAGGTLALSGSGTITGASSVALTGALDISQASSGLSLTNALTGSGHVYLGNNTLTLNATGTFSGSITDGGIGGGAGGSLTVSAGTITLNGSNTYTGATTIGGSGTLTASSTTALASSSAYTVSGTMNVNSSNTISSLSGSGTVTIASSQFLAISSGGNFSGRITGSGGISITGGTLTLSSSSVNDYSGNTLLSGSGALVANAANAFSGNSAVTLNDTSSMNLVTFSNTIGGLSGDVNTNVNVGSGATLTVTGGGTYQGVISGAGNLATNTSGTLTLSNNNTLSGTVTVGGSTTLALASGGQFSSGPATVVSGTLDISAVTTGVTLGSMSGGGAISLGSKTLTINETSTTTLSANITGTSGGIVKTGTSTLTISGTNTYSGATTISNGTLTVGVSGAIPSTSDVTVSSGATLSLTNSFISATAKSLSGAGTLSLTGGTLTINNGGTFSGPISASAGSLTLAGGTFTYSGTGSYTGATSISGGTFALSGSGSIANSASIFIGGAFDISGANGSSVSIVSISGGNGAIALGNNTLVITGTASSTFNGNISGSAGGLTLSGAFGATSLALGGNNVYSGATTINASTTLTANNSTHAFSYLSDFTVAGVLSLGGYNNSIRSLSGAGTVSLGSGTLTISNGGSFTGGIGGTGGINLTGGTLTLTNNAASNNYSGSTTLSGSASLVAGAANSFSQNSAVILNDTSSLDLVTFSNTIGGLSGDVNAIVNSGTGATLTVMGGGTFQGVISGVGNLATSTSGTLTLSNNNTLSGSVTIGSSTTLALSVGGEFSNAPVVTVSGTLDISGVTTGSTFGTLSGSGAINLGSKILTINETSATTFSGNISGITGGFTKTGSSNLTLSGVNAYGGSTTISSGTLIAGSTTALASASDFILSTGNLSLNGFSNTVKSLSGSGSATIGSATLTVTNGGTFTGQLLNGSGTSNFTLTGGRFTYSGAAASSGVNGTVAINGGTFALSGSGELTNAASLSIAGAFDISGASTDVTLKAVISGSGSIALGNNGLTLTTATSSFAGTIADDGAGGSLTLQGGIPAATLTLSSGSTSTYYGLTTIQGNASLLVGNSTTALSPNSDFLVNGVLDLSSYNRSNSVKSLSGSGIVTLGSATLTIANGSNGSEFNGNISGTGGGISLTGGTLTFASGSKTYTGATILSNNALLQATAAGVLASGSFVTLNDTSELSIGSSSSNTIGGLSGDSNTTVSIGSSSTLTVTGGGTYQGVISGAGSLAVTGGTLTLSNNNTLSGAVSVSSATLALTGAGAFSNIPPLTLTSGTLTISGVTTGVAFGNLSGTGAIQLGDKTLTVHQSSTATLTANISGTGGSFIKEGVETLVLAGTNSYTGDTTVAAGTLKAGSTSALAPLSDFVILEDALLDLNTFNNTIHSLSGAGDLYFNGAVLTITDGGVFSGDMTSGDILNGSFILTGGTLVLSGTNTDNGPNIIRNGATVRTGSSTALSVLAGYQVDGTLDLDNYSNSVAALTGSGSVTTGTGVGGTLTIGASGNFSGAITGNGGLSLSDGATVTLSTATSANTYSGQTTIGAAVLIAGATNAFSPNSDFVLNDSAILDLGAVSNTIKSLSSSYSNSTVSLVNATLTINGGQTTTFAGILTNTPPGALTIDGGTDLTLSGTSNDYTGPTLINDGTLNITGAGALSPYTNITVQSAGVLDVIPTSQAVSITNNGEVIINPGPLALSDFYTQTSGADLTLGFTESLNPILTAVNDINLNGTLTVDGSGSPTGVYPIIQSSAGDIPTEFSAFEYAGFDAGTAPFLAYSDDTVYLYFASCNASWNSPGLTVLTRAWENADNWLASCVPGTNGNQDDVANFPDFGGAPANITVKVSQQYGLLPAQLVLAQLNLSAVNTSYNITQINDNSLITFDLTAGGSASINVTGGAHTVDVPLMLNVDTRLNLSSGVSLTFADHTTLNSDTTQDFTIQASGSSDSGQLLNDTLLTPYSVTMKSATLVNNSQILPVNGFYVNALANHTVTITNQTDGAAIGPTARGGIVSVVGDGNVTINNTAAGVAFGPTGVGATMSIASSGTTAINNTGVGASFGPTGIGSSMTVANVPNLTITNSGVGTIFGPTGRGSNLTLSGGTITNSSGALIQAGSAATLTISGATITNDLSSVIGTTDADINFTSGSITTSGNVVAYNYTQSGTATLQLNITSADQGSLILGNVAAEGTAQVGSNLIVNALAGSITSSYDTPIDLVVADRGVSGTYNNVQYLNFPATVIPDLLYTPDAVQLILASTIPDSPSGSFANVAFLGVNEANMMTQRDLHNLHFRMMKRNKKGEKEQTTVSSLGQITPDQLLVDASNDLREQHYLAERTIEKAPNPARFYLGPTGQLGSFDGKGSIQRSFDFNAVGGLMGFDYAFETVGLGINLDYSRVNGKEHHYAGKFEVDEVRGALYGAWVPETLDALAIDAIVGWGGQWFDIHRTAGPSMSPVTAKGTTRGMEADALFGAEYVFGNRQFSAIPSKVLFTPFINAQYIWEGINGYKENGAGIYSLSVDKQRAQSLRSCIGTRFEYLVEGKNFTFKPELDLAWQREFLDHNRTLGFTSINSPTVGTVTKGIVGAGRNTFLVGADFLITVYNVFEIEMSYDFEWNNLYRNNSFYFGIGGNF